MLHMTFSKSPKSTRNVWFYFYFNYLTGKCSRRPSQKQCQRAGIKNLKIWIWNHVDVQTSLNKRDSCPLPTCLKCVSGLWDRVRKLWGIQWVRRNSLYSEAGDAWGKIAGGKLGWEQISIEGYHAAVGVLLRW